MSELILMEADSHETIASEITPLKKWMVYGVVAARHMQIKQKFFGTEDEISAETIQDAEAIWLKQASDHDIRMAAVTYIEELA